ncbi:MAG: NADH-quinone oxidoreductase subunit K [Thiohalocapsa sp.]|jgi:multicomponent Na+:H+ antiporter subunit C|uniref:NADH-quinone oxidoreductase subunit K n=1 Tax=Thiohalocapsa sp. TaxID=2497641 RepID=UPI0025EC0517|nr:NADH-quinone oxidoreductase subunit K [Thiohalocapsa sp.]MCG6942636.1 NADH-quinone oxidoreductase subunit K [Thiohalocapsa sp.]
MNEAQLYGVCGAGLVGIGLYGAILGRSTLRRLLAFNLVGSGVFLIFGAIARRGGLAGGAQSDPVPQALVITGLVVAFAATALAVALLIRLATVAHEAASAAATPGSTDDPSTPATASQGRGERGPGHVGAGHS